MKIRKNYKIDSAILKDIAPIVKKEFRDNETLYVETLMKEDVKRRLKKKANK